MVCPSNPNSTPPLNKDAAYLEKIYHRSSAISFSTQLLSTLKAIAQFVSSELNRDSRELNITKFYAIDGHPYWQVYDPKTRRNFVAHSEQDIRTWLDVRYGEWIDS